MSSDVRPTLLPGLVWGVGRDAKCGTTLVVYCRRCPTDTELREVHERLRDSNPAAACLGAESRAAMGSDALAVMERAREIIQRERDIMLSSFCVPRRDGTPDPDTMGPGERNHIEPLNRALDEIDSVIRAGRGE